MRKRIVAGNWKMNKTLGEALLLTAEVMSLASSQALKASIVLGVPFPYLLPVKNQLGENSAIAVAAQNCSDQLWGAYTGEVSAAMLRSMNIPMVIIGHSERRQYFGENGKLLAAKTTSALNNDMTPIFCCGESLEVRERGTHESLVREQVSEGLFHLSENELKKVVIAYEPVWAIGTGKTATTAQAQEMHAVIRQHLVIKYGKPVADGMSILYGGSVKSGQRQRTFCLPRRRRRSCRRRFVESARVCRHRPFGLTKPTMSYTCLEVTCDPVFVEILIAEMAEAGFDSFLETEKGFEAYAEEGFINVGQLSEIKMKYAHVVPLVLEQHRIEKKNWNEEWERNLSPIVVDDRCLIRAEFHSPDKQYPFEIIITPKMSFGTGHHQTTYLMVKNQMSVDHVGKRVIDAGAVPRSCPLWRRSWARWWWRRSTSTNGAWSMEKKTPSATEARMSISGRERSSRCRFGRIRPRARQHQQECFDCRT